MSIKENIIYTNEDLIVFKDERTSWSMGNYVGKTLKEIEELEGKEIKKVSNFEIIIDCNNRVKNLRYNNK